MYAPKDHAYDTDILETLSKRVRVGDGAGAAIAKRVVSSWASRRRVTT